MGRARNRQRSNLPRRGGHVSREDNYTPLDGLLFEDTQQPAIHGCDCGAGRQKRSLSHRLYSYAPLVGEEDEYLIRGVELVVCEKVQLVSAMAAVDDIDEREGTKRGPRAYALDASPATRICRAEGGKVHLNFIVGNLEALSELYEHGLPGASPAAS